MAMWDLVSGAAACAVPGSSSSNALGALANALIGSSSKTQERLWEIPTAAATTADSNFYVGPEEPFASLPGSELGHIRPHNAQASEFLQGFQFVDQNGLLDAWNEIQGPQNPQYQSRNGLANFPFEQPHLQQDFRVNALLSSLDIDNDIRARGPIPGKFPELEEHWNESQHKHPGPHGKDNWVSEFAQHRLAHGDPNMWAQSFKRQRGSNGWASEFEDVRKLSLNFL